jgi:hypothetical protein
MWFGTMVRDKPYRCLGEVPANRWCQLPDVLAGGVYEDLRTVSLDQTRGNRPWVPRIQQCDRMPRFDKR